MALWQVDLLAHAARRDAGLGLTALRVLVGLVQHANADRLAWPSTARLADMLGMTCPAVSNGLSELSASGWIEKASAGRKAWRIIPKNSPHNEYSFQSENSSVSEEVSSQSETEIHSTVKQHSLTDEQNKVLNKKEEGGKKKAAPRATKSPDFGLPVGLLSPEIQGRLNAVRDVFGRHPNKAQAQAIAAADPGIVSDALGRVKERSLSRFGPKWFVDSMERLAAEQREQAATTSTTAGPPVIDQHGNVINTPRPARATTGRAAMGDALRKRMNA